MTNHIIRSANPEDAEALTEISFASKRFWKDPESYFEVWKNELTITGDYIENNRVFVAENGGTILGYYAITQVKEDFVAGSVFVRKGFWLEHLFVRPDWIKTGIGSLLMNHAIKFCKDNHIPCLSIFSDPHATGFYDRMGGVYEGESPSSISGRTVALYRLDI